MVDCLNSASSRCSAANVNDAAGSVIDSYFPAGASDQKQPDASQQTITFQ